MTFEKIKHTNDGMFSVLTVNIPVTVVVVVAMVARDRLAFSRCLALAVRTHTQAKARNYSRNLPQDMGRKEGARGVRAGQGLFSCQCALFHVAGDDRWLMMATVGRRLLDSILVGFDVRFKFF